MKREGLWVGVLGLERVLFFLRGWFESLRLREWMDF